MGNEVLAAIGEALIDFIPDKTGCEFYEVTGFRPEVGGAPANVCAAFSILGGRSRLITKLGNDPFGDKIVRELGAFGVDTSFIKMTDEANTALAFVSLGSSGERTFSFYRKPSADMLFSADELDTKSLDDVFCLHFCSVSLGEFPMREAHKKAIETVRSRGGIISFDPNLRFQLWDNREKLRETVKSFIPMSDIIKLSDEELEFITGETDIESALPKLFRGHVKLVIYTCGRNGAYAFTDSYGIFSSAQRVEAADTTGAGDGFIGAFLFEFMKKGLGICGLKSAEGELRDCLDFANKFCAYSVQHNGAAASYPKPEIIDPL